MIWFVGLLSLLLLGALKVIVGAYGLFCEDQDYIGQLCHQRNRANERRKRFERALKRERAAHMKVTLAVSRALGEALIEQRRLQAENEKLTRFYRSLAADVVGDLLTARDRETVTKGLTRKV